MKPSTIPTEDEEQANLFAWATIAKARHPELALLYAIPNGGKRPMSVAVRMKRTGTKAGVPDMFLPVARGGCHGLYIELKRSKGGRVSPEQTAWMHALTEQGYRCAVCHGWTQARLEILDYLQILPRELSGGDTP